MRSSLVPLKAVTVAREAGASVAPLFKDGYDVLFWLAERDLVAAKKAFMTVFVNSGVVGKPAARAIEGAESAEKLNTADEEFGFGNCFTDGRSENDITNETLEVALPAEAMMQLPRALLVNWLADDSSRWWLETKNTSLLAEIVAELIKGNPQLCGDFLDVVDLEVVFRGMVGDTELGPKLAVFCAHLQSGVRNRDVFNERLLVTFSVKEIVSVASREMVWDFCKEQLQLLAGEEEETVEEESTDGLPTMVAPSDEPPATRSMTPVPPLQSPTASSATETMTCSSCNWTGVSSGKFCPDCGQPLQTQTVVTTS